LKILLLPILITIVIKFVSFIGFPTISIIKEGVKP
jgi:hypothetical protein